MNDLDVNKQKIKQALLKKCLGYNTKEIVEEYVVENKEVKLTKKKITKKHIPADISAMKLYFDYFNEGASVFENMTDTELDQEAVKLIKRYQELTAVDILQEIKKEENGATN